MKNAITLFFMVILLTMATALNAQKLGVKAGLNLSNILIKDNFDTYTDNNKLSPGFNAGVTVEFSSVGIFGFETGLMLMTKGFRYEEKGADYNFSEKANVYYIDVPITAKATFDVGGPKIYALLGPFVGVGITGKYKWDDTYMGYTDSGTETVTWGSDADNDDFKRLDYGIIGGAGAQINSIKLEITYGLGLANISAYTEDGFMLKNRVISLSVGYIFGGK